MDSIAICITTIECLLTQQLSMSDSGLAHPVKLGVLLAANGR
jgi:hypothetical protein